MGDGTPAETPSIPQPEQWAPHKNIDFKDAFIRSGKLKLPQGGSRSFAQLKIDAITQGRPPLQVKRDALIILSDPEAIDEDTGKYFNPDQDLTRLKIYRPLIRVDIVRMDTTPSLGGKDNIIVDLLGPLLQMRPDLAKKYLPALSDKYHRQLGYPDDRFPRIVGDLSSYADPGKRPVEYTKLAEVSDEFFKELRKRVKLEDPQTTETRKSDTAAESVKATQEQSEVKAVRSEIQDEKDEARDKAHSLPKETGTPKPPPKLSSGGGGFVGKLLQRFSKLG